MNLFIMNNEDILKYYKPQTENEHHLVEVLSDTYNDLYKLQVILSDYSLTYDNAESLDRELNKAFDYILELEDTIERLKERLNNEQ